jgi:para-aminobenzoate synthetase/4-amino-4-deoxychorismate lyase
MNHSSHDVMLRDETTGRWLVFSQPRTVIEATTLAGVMPALRAVEDAVTRRGLFAAGFLSYDAAPAFDDALRVRGAAPLPLLWFGLYHPPAVAPEFPGESGVGSPGSWRASVSRAQYDEGFEAIKRHIAAGDAYQVNYTYRLRAPFDGDPHAYFAARVAPLAPAFGALVDGGDWSLCSASPELFFRLEGGVVTSRPMKGTLPAGASDADNTARAERLRASEKNRAENVMIVDMVRNDLGRIAKAGSVRVPSLFDIERHPTVLQMTSTVTARTTASAVEVLSALFPAASITGAPKARSMEIIAEVETTPRGVYTGAIGWIAPGRRAQFSVAIRTLTVDRRSQTAEYGTGGGIVWDSLAADEYAESRVKARVVGLDRNTGEALFETMRWESAAGFARLDAHLARLRASAAHFACPCDEARVRRVLDAAVAGGPPGPQRVRLVLDRDGAARAEVGPLDDARPRRVTLARDPVDETDPWLRHKSTRRAVYDDARASRPGFDDVILFNRRGEVTESTIANLAVEIDGQLFTPPLECGLLPGVERAALLAAGVVRERVIGVGELLNSPRVCLMNSVRGMWDVSVDTPAGAGAPER